MKNIPLLLFDLVCLPITIIRLLLIYFFGSRYDIPPLQFLDVMAHATEKFFNQGQHKITIDTVPTDVRLSINRASRVDTELLNECAKYSIQNRYNDNKLKGGNPKGGNPNGDQRSIFGQKGGSTIVLHTDRNASAEDIKKLQILLPKILSQISLMNDKNNHIDTDNIDISKLDKKLDDEIKKELDFISFDIGKDLGLYSITDLPEEGV